MYEKIQDFILKRKVLFCGIVFFAVIVIPIIINCLFKLKSQHEFFIAEWKAGDVLSYYASMLTCISTTFLAYVAVKESNRANQLNNQLLQVSQNENKAFISLNMEEINIKPFKENCKIDMFFVNITNCPICSIKIKESNKNLYALEFSDSKLVKINNDFIFNTEFNEQDVKIKRTMELDWNNGENTSAFIVPFEVEIESVYGLITKQTFNLFVIKDLNFIETCSVCDYRTRMFD